ncbi:MAG: hypothetical protein QGI21_07235 [Candidatus Poseidoniaceae archaeon]|jgi:hypothetical protein|nr:hypothetical protein [Candidatus Poseidoniaceae archaeon]
METTPVGKDWSISTMSWYAIFVWFGASLFSQMVYLAMYGVPYDATIMIESAGTYAWILIVIELIIWVIIAIHIIGKLLKRLRIKGLKTPHNEFFTPQS